MELKKVFMHTGIALTCTALGTGIDPVIEFIIEQAR